MAGILLYSVATALSVKWWEGGGRGCLELPRTDVTCKEVSANIL